MLKMENNDNLYNSSLGPEDQDEGRNTPDVEPVQSKVKTPSRHSKDNSVVEDEPSYHQPEQTLNNQVNKVKSNPILEEDRQYATYDPFWDLKNGRSEKEVLAKLKSDNSKLRSELKSVSEDLTMLLERKKVKMNIKHTQPVKEMVNGVGASEQQIHNELKAAKAHLARLEKEMESMKGKYETEATFERYEALKDKMVEKEAQAVTLNTEKKQKEKVLRDIERTLQSLYNVSEGNMKINSLEQDIRLEREKIRESERRMEAYANQVEKRKKLEEDLQKEMQTVQADLRRVQEKTKIDPSQVEIPSTKNEKISKANTVGPAKKKVPISKHQEVEAPPCNTENFEKLKKEIKILTVANEKRDKHHEKKIEELNEQLAKVMKTKEDAEQKLAEKQKEILILTSKSKDISRIVRHHTVAPLQREEQQQQLAGSNPIPSVTIENGNRGYKKGEKPAKSPDRKAQSTYLLTEKARAKFYSKGYRKDEKGQIVKEGEGINFNDKDIIGKNKVRIIAVDVWHDEEVICGIQAVYESDKKDVIEGGANVINPEGVKMTTFETLEEDYVKEINGFMNKDGSAIECLLMKTYRGDSMKIGKPSKDGKFFRYDINELEHPTCLFGSIKTDKSGASKLVRLGVLISADAVEELIEEKKEEVKEPENIEKKEDEEVNKEENAEQNQSKSRVEQTNRSKVEDEEGDNQNEGEEVEQDGENQEQEEEEVVEEGEEGEGEGEEEIEEVEEGEENQ